MDDLSMLKYHEWLLNRSIKGLLYRRFYLYPKIWRRIAGSVLDIGCGIGDFVRLTKNSIGADINPYNIAYCKKRGIPAVFFENNMLPFADEKFDAVLFDNVLEHIYESSEILNEAVRVLKVGGKLVVGVPTLKHFFHDTDHKIYYSSERLKNAIEIDKIRFEELFVTPENTLIQRYFVHTCRWVIYEKISNK